MPSLNLLCHSKTEAWFMQDGWKAVWSIPYVSMVFFPSLKQNFIAYRSSKVSDCNFDIHHLWRSGFIRVYSNCCCRCWFEPEIIKIGQSSHKIYSNNILNIQEPMTILNTCTKKSGNLLNATCKFKLIGYTKEGFYYLWSWLLNCWEVLSFVSEFFFFLPHSWFYLWQLLEN